MSPDSTDDNWEGKGLAVVVEDGRKGGFFMIENGVVDDWLRIIGPMGFALYSLFVRTANRKDRRSYTGYKKIALYLGVDKATVGRYSWLLDACGLVERDVPELEYIIGGVSSFCRDRTKVIRHEIQNVPAVTPERLAKIRKAIEAKTGLDSYQTMFLRAVDEWRSIEIIQRGGRKPPNPAQPSLPLEGVAGLVAKPSANGKGKAKTKAAEVPETAAVGLLREVGITKRAVLAEFAGLDVVLVQATIWRAQVDPATQSLTGRIITDLREDYPTAGFVDFARFWWEELDEDGRKDFLDWMNGRLIDISGLVNDWELNRAAAEAGLAVVKFWKGLT